MKKITIIGLTALALKTSLFANGFAALLYAPGAEGKELGGQQFDDTNYIKLKAGTIGSKSMEFGYYADFGFTFNSTNENGTSSDVKYNYYIFNAGPTLAISENIVVYAGVGVAHQRGVYFNNGEEFTTEDTKTELNINGGAMLTYGDYGLVAGYDSAAKAANFGFLWKF